MICLVARAHTMAWVLLSSLAVTVFVLCVDCWLAIRTRAPSRDFNSGEESPRNDLDDDSQTTSSEVDPTPRHDQHDHRAKGKKRGRGRIFASTSVTVVTRLSPTHNSSSSKGNLRKQAFASGKHPRRWLLCFALQSSGIADTGCCMYDAGNEDIQQLDDVVASHVPDCTLAVCVCGMIIDIVLVCGRVKCSKAWRRLVY